jgi:hypothetical protein
MPNLRIMNWNIEQLSWDKIRINGMVDAIARTIVSQNIDILIILEVRSTNVGNMLNSLTTALNNVSGHATNYTMGYVSAPTGMEYYGFVIKDLNAIRPITVIQPNPLPEEGPVGSSTNPLTNLDELEFQTWPNTFANLPDAYPVPAIKRYASLTDVYAAEPPKGRHNISFGGQTLDAGGYALGRGFRLPCLAMFQLHTGTVIPIITCHYAAVRSGKNQLAGGQIKQLYYTHIAQKFNTGGNIKLNGVNTLIEEIIFTGDFNVNFLQTGDGETGIVEDYDDPGGDFATTVYGSLTEAAYQTGSADPDAYPGTQTLPNGAGDPPLANLIPPINLKAADTSQGTILHHYDANVDPPNTQALPGACFDNFFFGGRLLSANLTIGFGYRSDDACDVYDLPSKIDHQAPQPDQIRLDAVALHYWNKRTVKRDRAGNQIIIWGTKNARSAPNLLNNATPLTINDRLIGARFVSDHLPTIIEFENLL